METKIGVEGNDETKADNGPSDAGSDLIAIKPISDPVVYKLVRVDGDGRLVPATDDEVMVVEDLLKDDKNEVNFSVEGRQPMDTSKRSPLENAHHDSSGGLSGNLNVDPNMEQRETKRVRKPTKRYIEEISEVGSRESSGRLVSTAKNFEAVDLGKANANLEESVHLLAQRSNGLSTTRARKVEGCSSSQGGSILKGSSTFSVGISLKPDFSMLKGEICLDNLTVKDLQETFKATFGRETSVKDKQWLKRRISMGLTNSCDFSTTTFMIEDNKVVKKTRGEISKSSAGLGDLADEISTETGGAISDIHDDQINLLSNIDAKKPEGSSMAYNSVSEDLKAEQKTTKRVRKPTKRYIEEISEGESRESSGRMVSPVKRAENGQAFQRAFIRPIQYVQTDGRPIVTREDSFGGSGVQVPYVSRVRRGRPREDIMTLTKLQHSDIGIAAEVLENASGEPVIRLDNDSGSNIFTARLSLKSIEQPLIVAPGKGNHFPERTMELEKDLGLKSAKLLDDNPEDNSRVTMPAPMGGMRRKHHRPWSLTEVVKLVEGVARYGAGRWSEIKRLAFASYSYRTSVDLKDKWRNLLRASLNQLPAERGIQNPRKHASIPIPAPILLRVRELAEIQAPNLSTSNYSGHSGGTDRSVEETRSGYL